MIGAVSGSPAALPLLQFTCRALWDRKRPGTKTIERSVHDAIGGVAGALASHADGVLDGMSEIQLRLARAILLRLVTAEGTRRLLDEEAIDALGAAAGEVRERFVEARLLSVHRSPEGRRYELAHESLITTWKRLARWIDEEREDLAFLEEIERAAELWKKRGRRSDEAWREQALAEAKLKLSRMRRPLPVAVREFVEAGEALEKKRAVQRRVLSAIAFVLLASLALLFYRGKERAEAERGRAEIQRARAEREASELAYARGDTWAARARLRSALEISDDVRARALWLRLEADPIRFSRRDEAVRVLAGDRYLLLRWQEPILVLDPIDFEPRGTIEAPPESYVFAAHGEMIATGTSDGSVVIAGGRGAKHHQGPVSALAFSRDGKMLASGGWDGTVLLHRLPSLEVELAIAGHTDRIYGIRFGEQIYTAGWDGTLRATDPISGVSRELWRSPAKILDLELEGDTLAVGREDGAIEVHRGDEHRVIRDHSLSVTALAFHPLQPWLASASWDGTVRLFDLDSGRALGSPIRVGDKANDLAFRPGSSQAMVVLRGSGIVALDLSQPYQADDPGPPPLADVIDVAGDGTIAVTAPGNRIVLRDPANGRALRLLEGHSDLVRAVAFRPGHAELASGGFDETVRVFDTITGRTRHILTGHRAPISMVAYSPDGKLLASAGFDQKLRIFDADSGSLLAVKEAPARLITVHFSPDGRIASGTFAGHIDVYRTSDFGRIASHRCTNQRIAHEIAFDGERVLAICGPALETFGGGASVIGLGAEYACLDLSADRMLHTSGEGIQLSDRIGALVARIARPTHACAFSPDGSFFVTVEPDGAVRRYDRDGRPAWQGESGVRELVFGELSASGKPDGTAAIRDREGELISVRLFGPISGFALTSSTTLSITSELGDRRDLDIAPLVHGYCDLMRSLWERAPAIWRGSAVPAGPPDHVCR
jgi:WD40 repeat protein